MVVEGLGNPYRVVEGIQHVGPDPATGREPRLGWVESATISGRLDGRTLRIEPSCSSNALKKRTDERRERLDEILSDLD